MKRCVSTEIYSAAQERLQRQTEEAIASLYTKHSPTAMLHRIFGPHSMWHHRYAQHVGIHTDPQTLLEEPRNTINSRRCPEELRELLHGYADKLELLLREQAEQNKQPFSVPEHSPGASRLLHATDRLVKRTKNFLRSIVDGEGNHPGPHLTRYVTARICNPNLFLHPTEGELMREISDIVSSLPEGGFDLELPSNRRSLATFVRDVKTQFDAVSEGRRLDRTPKQGGLAR